ncbi:MAG: hypothetical protein GXP27_07265 [Planctomycetes bacterium]|nr:hypothetical protein [Planctomycetota bacterium]
MATTKTEIPTYEGQDALEAVDHPTGQTGQELSAWRERVLECEQEVQEAELEMLRLREDLKEARKRFETAVQALRRAIRDEKSRQLELSFGPDANDTISPDNWGQEEVYALQSYGLTESQCEKIAAGLEKFSRPTTVRALRDWIAEDALWHRKIDGVGPATVDRIVDALTAYQQANPEAVSEEPS